MRMHFPVGQRVPARPLPGEEYGESKNTAESDWFARGFCNDSDADRNLEPSRGRRLMQLCECADSFQKARGRIAVCRRHLSGSSTCESVTDDGAHLPQQKSTRSCAGPHQQEEGSELGGLGQIWQGLRTHNHEH
jgi:hypothetical protein